MFQLSCVKTRYFELEDPDNGQVLHLEPPKMKTLNRLTKVSKDKDIGVYKLTEVVASIISKNKEGRKVTADTVMEWMTNDQLSAFLGEFLDWLNKTRADDPN